MKIFKVWVSSYGWDDFDSAVVIAESEEEVRKNFVKHDNVYYYLDSDELYFLERQGEIHIKEVGTKLPGIICASFNAG